MSTQPDFLDAENAITALLTELEKLKSATDEIEATRVHSQTVVGAATEVVHHTRDLVQSATLTLKALEDLKLADRMDRQDRQLAAAMDRDGALLSRQDAVEVQLGSMRKLTTALVVLAAAQLLMSGSILFLILRP